KSLQHLLGLQYMLMDEKGATFFFRLMLSLPYCGIEDISYFGINCKQKYPALVLGLWFLNFIPEPANRNDCYEKLKRRCCQCYDYGRIAVMKGYNAVHEKYY
ncbi:MAG: hypothetical protein J6W63_02195, partial [Treponema sp.]|nr:hypothetical protein [Treponema sp.]